MRTSRRRLLATLAAVGGLSGCLGVGAPATGSRPSQNRSDPGTTAERVSRAPPGTSTPASNSTTVDTLPLARHGSPPTICEESIHEESGIAAIVDPAFAADWSDRRVGRQYSLDDGDVVIGLERDGIVRAYPISILYYHEVVDDHLDVPVAVTYCPLCNSGMVADRRVDDRVLTFHVSGLLWQPPGLQTAAREQEGQVFGVDGQSTETRLINRGNLVMYDEETESYWSQILATAICGEFRGSELEIVPSTTATWGDWRSAHPETAVLLPPPQSGTDSHG